MQLHPNRYRYQLTLVSPMDKGGNYHKDAFVQASPLLYIYQEWKGGKCRTWIQSSLTPPDSWTPSHWAEPSPEVLLPFPDGWRGAHPEFSKLAECLAQHVKDLWDPHFGEDDD